ncbi:MAG: ADOP family duplicated permease [Acidobacteriota bacterium]
MPSRLSSLWRNLARRDRVDREIDDELGAMYALLVEEKTRAGMSPDRARREARLELGHHESVKTQVRDARTGASFDVLLKDIRYGARSLRRTPGFTIAAIVTLALGIGANATIFTLLDAVILKALPVPAPQELVTLYENGPEGTPDPAGGTGRYLRFSYPRFARFEQAVGAQASLAAATRSTRFIIRLPGNAQAIPARGQLVSGGYFTTLGVPAARGRLLSPNDVRLDRAGQVAVIGDGFWKRVLGGAETALGQTLVVNGVSVTVVGIAPPGFGGIWADVEADLWLPVTLQPVLRYQNNSSAYDNADRNKPWIPQDSIAWLNLIGRVREADRAQVTARLQAANRAALIELIDLSSSMEDQERRSLLAHALVVEPLARGFSGLRARYSNALVVLSVMVTVVLLITCANLANLMLARGARHAREMAIRISLGATTGRLVRQGLTESLLIALVGGAIGLLASGWASPFLARQVLNTSGQLPMAFAPDIRVILFTAAVSLATVVLFGIAPSIRAARAGRRVSIATTERQHIGQASMKGMRPLVALQLALAVVVVGAAVLLGRTLLNFARVDPGFATAQLVTASFDPDPSGYTREEMPALEQRLVAATAAVPGVVSASVSSCGLVANCSFTSSFHLEGVPDIASLQANWIGPAHFATVGVPLVGGREFDERDRAGSQPVAIVTESIARRYFTEGRAIGKRLGFEEPDVEIVGVARDARSTSLREPPVPMVFFPIAQPPAFRVSPTNLDVRVAGDAAVMVQAIRDALRGAEPRLMIDGVVTMSTRLERDVNRERVAAYLTAAFAGLALLLAAIGLYGVLSYAVAQRTREIGVRVALGARRSEVAALVIRDAIAVVGTGLVVGVIAALAAGRMLQTLLFEVSPADPVTLALVLALLIVVTLAAVLVPARRAALVDPIVALRNE